MARTVSSPDGNRWYVRRVWLPWRPRWRRWRARRENLDLDVPEGCAVDALDDLFIVIGVVLAAVLFVLFVLPLLIALLELTVLVLLVLLGGLARVVLRKPWIVEATPATGTGRLRWKVVGWRRSGEVVDEVARQLEAGHRTPSVPGAAPA